MINEKIKNELDCIRNDQLRYIVQNTLTSSQIEKNYILNSIDNETINQIKIAVKIANDLIDSGIFNDNINLYHEYGYDDIDYDDYINDVVISSLILNNCMIMNDSLKDETIINHPILASELFWNTVLVQKSEDRYIYFASKTIKNCIAAHMGRNVSSDNKEMKLPVPENFIEKFLTFSHG